MVQNNLNLWLQYHKTLLSVHSNQGLVIIDSFIIFYYLGKVKIW